MKVATIVIMLVAASPSALGRKLLQDGCADFSALASVPEVSDIVSIINGFGLLPGGIPSNVTVFLPNNDAVAALLAGVPFPGLTVESLPSRAASLPASLGVVERLISALLYHIVPGGAWEPEALVAEGTLPTALEEVHPGFGLQFAEVGPANYTVTTVADEVASTSDPVLACGSAVYVIDKVLVPATGLLDPAFPLTTLDEALAVLGGGSLPAAPAPAP